MIALALHVVRATLFPPLLYLASLFSLEHQLEWAIASVSDDAHEQRVLLRIARIESGGFDPRILSCEKRGTAGEVTAWQILVRSETERAHLCVSYVEDARMALERVRESERGCAHLPGPWRLGIYARGTCNSAEGRRLSEIRWVP